MARKSQQLQLRFPLKGINVLTPETAQAPDTCIDCRNVRPLDSTNGRMRGGIRPGTSKYLSSQFGDGNPIQNITQTTSVVAAAPNTAAIGVRDVRNVAVANGVISQFTDSAITDANTSGSRSLSSTAQFIFSASVFGDIYYVDGISYKIWQGSNNTTKDWTLTDGTLPGTDGTVAPRLIANWRSRLVLSGLRTDPHNWWMSALGDPLDYDFAPTTTVGTQAVAGSVGVVGKIADVVNALVPISDDVLVFGCDHSIWMMSGDPMAGGSVDLLSDTIGFAFGRAYCRDAKGTLYFLSSRGSVYSLSVSDRGFTSLTEQSIDPLVQGTDLNSTLVSMAWSEEESGFNLFLTPLS